MPSADPENETSTMPWPRFEEALARHQELEQQLADPAVIADRDRFTRVAKEHGSAAKLVKPYLEYKKLADDIAAAEAMAAESDPEMRRYAEEELAALRARQQALQGRLEDLLLIDPGEDFDSLIVEIRAGTGGEEAALFAGDLFRMYRKYAEDQGWKVEPLDFSGTDHGGFKEISFSVKGDGVYQALRYESGGHRVQRVPETEQQGRIHTSAATVAVLPEPTEVQVEINRDDVRRDTFRSGGPGGQHQNKTESGVRLVHLPTGVVAECRTEKSQKKNEDTCWRMLRSRIFEQMQERERAKRAAERKSQIGSGDRSERIRTYNFPQNRVTDHRINLTLYKLDAVIAGDPGELIAALKDFDRKQRLGQPA
jgi:peptide chain release factor 1